MFADSWKLVLVVLLILGGHRLAAARPVWARRVGRAGAVVSAIALASVVVSGIWRPPALVAYHRYAAHGLVILDWLLIWPCIGAAVALGLRRRPWRTVAQIALLASVFGFTILAASTAYLGPSNDPNVHEETQNRFQVLHLYALPAIVTALTACWFWSFRAPEPTTNSQAGRRNDGGS